MKKNFAVIAAIGLATLAFVSCNTIADITKPMQKLNTITIWSGSNESSINTSVKFNTDPSETVQTIQLNAGQNWFKIDTSPAVSSGKVAIKIWDAGLDGSEEPSLVQAILNGYQIKGEQATVWIIAKHQDADNRDGLYKLTIKKGN